MNLFFKRSVLVQNTINCGCVPSLPTIILEKGKNHSDLKHTHASNPNISYINISYRTYGIYLFFYLFIYLFTLFACL